MSHFGLLFTFARPTAAAYRNIGGELVEAVVDEPRFDHDEAGTPRGLIVEPGNRNGREDRVRLANAIDGEGAPHTILHEYERDGVIINQAVYSTSPRATVDAMLSLIGHHRRIVAVPGYLANIGGQVRFDVTLWSLGGAIAIDEQSVFGEDDIILFES